jgi:hypothetical protein
MKGFFILEYFFIFSKNYSVQKIVNELINSSIKGVDVYQWKDSTWLIFTDDARWVLELMDGGTLWYNYRFFNNVFRYVSMDCGKETEDYITQWANDYFYKGIEKTEERGKNHGDEFEWHTRAVIDNGVKGISQSSRVESHSGVIGEVIEKGIKEVNKSESIHRQMRAENIMGRIIKESVKKIYPDKNPNEYDWSDEFEANKVIEGGIKVIPLPDMSGELRGYSDYYNTKEDRTKPHTEYVKETIEGGTKL